VLTGRRVELLEEFRRVLTLEQGIGQRFDDDVPQPSIQDGILEQLEDPQDSLTRRLASDQMLDLIWNHHREEYQTSFPIQFNLIQFN